MKLSIITVNLNNRDGLQKTIDSVICQTFRDFEWIVIDGGSTDGSKELIEQYADHFAYWVSEPDKGIYNAMNKGIKVAKGEYLQFLNSGDSLWNETTLQGVVPFFSGTTDIFYGDVAIMKEDKCIGIKKSENRLKMSVLYENSIPHPSSFIRAELLHEEQYDESFKIVSDWKFFIRKSLEKRSFFHLSFIVSSFDLSGVSSTRNSLLEKERFQIGKEEIPDPILADLEDYYEMECDWQMQTFKKYQSKRIYHKMITVFLKFIIAIDNIVPQKNG